MRWQEFKLVENKQTEQFKIKKAETKSEKANA